MLKRQLSFFLFETQPRGLLSLDERHIVSIEYMMQFHELKFG